MPNKEQYWKNREEYLQRQKDYHKFRISLIKIHKICQKCGSNKNLEMHHKKYNNPKFEEILLCKKCYSVIHRKK